MENNIPQTSQLQVKAYIPPKDWDKLTDGEKIERMREIIKQQSHALGLAQTQIHNLRMKLKRHVHQDGKVVEVKEVQDYDDTNLGGLVGTSTLGSNNYF